MEILKNHPFAVSAFFERSMVITYAAPLEHIKKLIPKPLTPDAWQNEFGFIAAAFVKTKSLRPKGFPEFLGNDFFLTGYRVFVNYKTKSGKRYRGLYILRSETDSKRMKWAGNIFTHYNYQYAPFACHFEEQYTSIQSKETGLAVEFEHPNSDIALPINSPFTNWNEARRFAGPLPFTFTVNSKTKHVLIIEGVRSNWAPEPLRIVKAQIPFIESLQIPHLKVANAFMVRNIPYYWKKGRSEKWD